MLKKCFKSVVTGLVLGALGMVLSCSDNVGLGESVDTESPSIEIAYPPASAIIRGSFVFAGSWKDDKGVKTVTAIITNTATKQTYPANTVTVITKSKVDPENAWYVTVNNYSEDNADYVNNWQLPDGKYELGVYATDHAGHKSGIATRTFEIDNTAPVTVLTSPGSTSTYTAYGSTFSVEGTIADEHAVESLAVTIYDENGNVLDSTADEPYTETSIQTAGGTSVSLLKFSERPVTDAQKRYSNIYGESREGGTKKYSCAIYVRDNARIYGEEEYKAYKASGDATSATTGNETSVFYLNASVYETLLSSVKGYGLSVTDLMTIINGTYVPSDDTTARAAGNNIVKGTLTAEELKEVQSLLFGDKSVAVDTSEEHLRFSLDPAVNPIYTVSGFSLEDSPNGTKNQTVTFIVSPGLDGTQFRPNTFSVYLLNCGLYNAETGFDSSKYNEFLADPAAYYEAHKDTTSFITSYADKYTDADTLSSLTATFKLPEIVADNYYIIGLSGYDLDDNELVSDGTFGFIGALSGTPPVIGFEKPVNQAILGSTADLVFGGEVTTTEVKLDKLTLTIDVTDVENGASVGSFKVSNVASDAGKIVSWDTGVEKDADAKFKYAWTFALKDAPEYNSYKAEAGDGKIYMYTVTAEARDSSGGENTANRTVTVDTLPPEVSITSVIPSVSGYTDASHTDDSVVYVNGIITITGSVNEMNHRATNYTVYVDDRPVEDLTDCEISTYSNFKIVIDTTKLWIEKDSSGNPIYVDDVPLKVVVTSEDRANQELNANENLLPAGKGKGNTGSYDTTQLNGGKPFYILQETDKPVIKPINADKDIQGQADIVTATQDSSRMNKNIFAPGDKLQVTVSDDDGISEVTVSYRSAGSSDSPLPLVSSYTASNNSLVSALPADYGVYEILVNAKDSVEGRPAENAENGTSEISFVVAMDDGAPTFSNMQPADNGYYAERFAVTGVITDKSGAVTLQLTSVTEDTETAKNQGRSESYASAVSLNGTADGAGFSDKITVPANSQTYRIVYKATDKYNQSKEYAIRYIVDKDAPTVEPPSIENASQSGDWFNSTSPRVTVHAKDNEGGSGVATVKAYVLKDTDVPENLTEFNDGTATGVDLAAGTKDSDTNFTPYGGLVSLQQGKNVVIVVVTDQATNKTRVKTDVIQVDTLSPTITLSALSDTLINKTEWENLSSGLTLTPTIVDEGSGVVAAWLDRQNTEAKESDATIKATTEAVTSSSGWKANLVIPQSDLTDGNHVYYVWAKDAAGRTSASAPISFTVDTRPPEIEVTALSNDGLYTEANVTNLDTTTRTAKYSIAGSWSDAFSGTETLQYTRNADPTALTVEGEDPATTWVTIPLSDKAAGVKLSWTNLIDVTESSGNTIAFRAKDTAGNITASDGYKVFKGITFDFSLPVITLTQRPATQTKEQVTIGGTVEDKLALSQGNISIVVTKGTEAQTVTPTITETTTGKAYSFDLTIPAQADHLNDGDWTVTIDAKDGAGRDAVQQKVAVKIDTTAPSVEKPTLSTSKGSEKDSVYYFNGSDIPTVAVSASDSGTGIASVAYGIVSGTTTAWSDSLVLKNITESTDKWTAMQMDSSVSDGFKVNVTDFNTLGDGEYVVFVRVVDNVGNTAYSEGYRVCNDKTLPVLEETVAGDKPVDATGKSFDSGNFTLTGTVSDTNYKELTVTRDTSDGDAPVLTVSDNTWKLTQTVANDEHSHTYTYTLTVKDYAGNEASISNRTVEIDRTAPTVTVEKLNDSAAEGGVFSTKEKNCIFTGKIVETGSGLHKAYALLYTGDTAPADPDAATGIASGGKSYESVSVNSDGSFTHTFYGQAEGTYHLKVVAFDKAGNTSLFTPVQVNVDNSAPVSTLSVTGSANGIKQIANGVASAVTISADNWNQKTVYITDGTFTLSGAVTDAFGFSADKIELSVNSTVVQFASKTENFVWSQSSDTFNWTYNQLATDGTYTYSLKMTDMAGNERTNEFKVQVDTKVPNILSITAPASNSNQTGDVVLTGQTADEGVGVQKISYQILKGDTPVAINGSTGPIEVTASGDEDNTLTGSTWKAKILTAGLPESGHLTLKVTATDYLGHTTSAERDFYRDSTPPVFEDDYPKVTTQVSAGEDWYKTSTLTVSVKATDDESGIASISFKVGIDGDEIAMTKNEDGTYSSANVVCKEGDNTIYVLAKNNVYDGTNGVTTKPITVHIDTVAPEFSAPAYSGLTYDASNASNTDVTVSGTITEALGLSASDGLVITATRKTSADGSSTKNETRYDADSLKEILKVDGTTTITAPSGATSLTDGNTNWSFKLPADTANHSTDGEWTFTITATDQAGNTASTKATVLMDTVAPEWSPSGTIASKDYYFTVGGKKYDAANWYKDTNLSITGYYIEDVTGSGISTVNYKITPPDGSSPLTGTISPNSATGISKFISEVAGFENGSILTFTASDEAGNTSTPISSYIIKIDSTEPELDSSSVQYAVADGEAIDLGTSTILTNATKAIVITGTVSDTASGIDLGTNSAKTISATRGSVAYDASQTDTSGKSATFTLTLSDDVLTNNLTNGVNTINITFKDVAGNSHTATVATIKKDAQAPEVSITAPTLTGVNKTITIKGSASDNEELDFVDIAISTDVGNTYTTFENGNGIDATSKHLTLTNNDWSFELDTTKYENTATEKPIKIKVTAQDKAGNTKEAVKDYTISQNGDRPIVKVTNLQKNGEKYVLKYGTEGQLTGTVTDDDSTSAAVVQVLRVANVASSATLTESEWNSGWTDSTESGVITSSHATYGRTELTLATGEWTYYPNAQADGAYTLYFYVKDNPGTTFATTKADALERPYWQYKTDSKQDNENGIAYSVDGSSPEVKTADVTAYSDEGGTTAYGKKETVGTSVNLGGSKKRYARFVFTAADANGVASMTATLSGKDKDNPENAKEITLYTATATDGTFEATSDSTPATWTTRLVDMSVFATDSVSLKVEPIDQNALKGNGTYGFMIDQTGPDLKVMSPSKTEEKTGDIQVTGSAIDKGTAGTEGIEYLVPTAEQAAMSDSELASLTGWTGYLAKDTTPASWTFNFNGGLTEYDNPSLTDFDDIATYATRLENSIYTIPLYMKATDALGNFSIVKWEIRHNPDGDKPKTEFSYPTKKDYDENATYVTLGGTIRAAGSAVIPSGTTTVGGVYYQISGENAAFDTVDKEKAAKAVAENGYGYDVVTAYDALNEVLESSTGTNPGYTSTTEFTEEQLRNYGFASNDEVQAWWAVKTTGSASWSMVLNASGELNAGEDVTEPTKITLRACGVNAKGKFGAWSSVVSIHVDDKAPTISPVINQYVDTVTLGTVKDATPLASQVYDSDMYLRGQWYLVLTVVDESGIEKLTVLKGKNLVDASVYASSETSVDENGTAKTGYKIYIPIDTSSSTVDYTVTAIDKDTTQHTTSQTFNFQIDNTAPTLTNLTGNKESLTEASVPAIQNSSYVYSLAGESTDEGSGVERIVFYYMRKAGVTKSSLTKGEVILDPLIDTTGSNYDPAKVTMPSSFAPVADGGVDKLEIKQGNETYNLYAYKVAGSSTTETFTANSVTLNDHVRIGGLIYIDGIYRRVTAKTGAMVTFEPAVSSASESITAWFPIAQVIDNGSSEKTTSDSAHPFTFEDGKDDGDLMPESFSKSGSTWKWDASIHSDNMPDGPVSLVILAFDNAGNVNGKTITTKITNNAPRLAKVFLATDLNSNNKFENDEFETYNIIGKEGKEQSSYALDFTVFGSEYGAGVFTAKNKLAIVPEIVGGNGTITLVAKQNASSVEAVTSADGTEVVAIAKTATGTNQTVLDAIGSSSYTITASQFTAAKEGNNFYAYVLTNAQLTGKESPTDSDDGDNKPFSFTFWDSTEETKSGTDSQNTVLWVKNFAYDLFDGESPTVVVNPFYWKNLNSNSIYGSDAKDAGGSYSVANVDGLQGHIELESDWKESGGYKNAENKTSGEYDTDPKVSGKITFTGTAYDEHSLKSLKFSFGKDGDYLFKDKPMATYDTEEGAWSNTAAWKAKAENASAVKTVAVDGYEVTIVEDAGTDYGVYEDSVYFGQTGHKIYWTLSIDTEKLTSVAATDVSLSVLATDLAGKTTATTIKKPAVSDGYIPASTTGTRTVIDGETNVPTYQMDVVPYVTKVTTALKGKLKTSIKEAYSRTALGHYIARSNEAIEIKGFNLGTADKEVEGAVVTGIKPMYGANELAVGADGTVTLPAEKIATSGKVSLTVSGIETLNNVNDNNAHGAYATAITDASPYSVKNTYAYNRLPNKTSNNLLTDDVAIDVWYFDSDAAKPRSGELREPVMRINPVTGKVGLAFVSGPGDFAMAGSGSANETTTDDNKSYQLWQNNYATFNNISFAYDANGYAHGTATGLDTNPGTKHAGRFSYFYSKWGQSGTGTTANYVGEQAVRLESIAVPKGNYTIDGVANRALFIKGAAATNDSLTETRFYSPSLVTTVHNTTTAVYLAYYDSIQGQIRFRYSSAVPQTWDKTLTTNEGNYPSGATGSGFQNLHHGNNDVDNFVDNVGYFTASNSNKDSYFENYMEAHTDHFSLIAGADYQQNYPTGYNTGYTAYKYVAIDAIKGDSAAKDVVVAVWYDGTNCRYAYNDDPTSGLDNGTAGGWKGNKVIFTEGGEHCTIKVDPNGGVHIAAYVDGGLKYAYLASYDASEQYSESTDSVLVDSFTITGERINLDAGLVDYTKADGTTVQVVVPYISYFNGTSRLPTVAKLVIPENGVMDYTARGTDSDDVFTGNWEISIVPSPETLTTNYYDKINIGLWKNSSGKVVKSNDTGFASATRNKTSTGNTSGTDNGHIYGNGTANPILGYAIESTTGTCFETAQMK